MKKRRVGLRSRGRSERGGKGAEESRGAPYPSEDGGNPPARIHEGKKQTKNRRDTKESIKGPSHSETIIL